MLTVDYSGEKTDGIVVFSTSASSEPCLNSLMGPQPFSVELTEKESVIKRRGCDGCCGWVQSVMLCHWSTLIMT